MKLLLDTTVLIALRKHDSRVEKAISNRKLSTEEIGISRLTEYELRVGGNYLWKKHGDARELAWLDEALQWLTIYEMDEDVVRNASDVQGQALTKGTPFPDMDLLIALSAKAETELLTLDSTQLRLGSFLKEKGIRVVSP